MLSELEPAAAEDQNKETTCLHMAAGRETHMELFFSGEQKSTFQAFMHAGKACCDLEILCGQTFSY